MRATILLVIFLVTVYCPAGQERAVSPAARTVTLAKDDIDLAEALAAIRKQTGTEVADRRSVKATARLRLSLDKATFWQALDAVARQADARISLYQDDGTVALVNGPYRAVPTSTQGIFRSTVRRLTTARNLETGGDLCTIEMETAWEPKFRPFLMEVGPATASYSGPMKRPITTTIPGQGRARIAGRAAITELRLPAPPRAAQSIDSLKGSVKLIGPTAMLVFRFDDLKANPKKPIVARQEGVKVEVASLVVEPDKWSFEIVINNPPGGPTYESHQSHLWLDNNRIWLQRGEGKSAVVWMPPPDEQESDKVSEARATIHYHFPLRHRTAPARVGKLEDWSLMYTTPGPIIETKVDYAFTALPLP